MRKQNTAETRQGYNLHTDTYLWYLSKTRNPDRPGIDNQWYNSF